MRRTPTWLIAAVAVLGGAGAVVANSPSPVFVDHCFETLPGVGTRYWVAVGGNDCDDAPIRIRTGNNSSPFLPDVEATQETDGRYNVTIISELGESFLLNTYIVEPQEAGIEFNVLRVAHLGRGFGDIGYHYIIDPQGTIWQGRPLNWQGAHVADQNPGNLGILVMGNFEVQRPTQAQLATCRRFVQSQMQRYSVPVSQVRTHREMAQTACPGRNLQPAIVSMRRPGGGWA